MNDGSCEYYEVKSGKRFAEDGREIKDCLMALFENFKSRPSSEKAKYFVIIVKEYGLIVAQFVADFKAFRQNKNITPKFKKYCNSTWHIKQVDINQFHEFIKLLSLDPNQNIDELQNSIDREIEMVKVDILLNTDHSLLNEDLANRLINRLLFYIRENEGNINLMDVAKTVLDWVTRSEVAYKTASAFPTGMKELMQETKAEILLKLQKKFPSIQIEVEKVMNVGET